MKPQSLFKVVVLFSVLIGVTIVLSQVSTKIWGGKTETVPATQELVIIDTMTVADFGQAEQYFQPGTERDAWPAKQE